MLMRHGRISRERTYWTGPHRAWIAAQSFSEPALATALGCYRATLDTRETELACIDAELAPWAETRSAGRHRRPPGAVTGASPN